MGNYILNQILTQEQGGREELVERCHEYLRGCVALVVMRLFGFARVSPFPSFLSNPSSPTLSGTPLVLTRCRRPRRADSVAEDLRTPGKVDLEKFIIHKNLTKDPEAYPDKKNQPHVLVRRLPGGQRQ